MPHSLIKSALGLALGVLVISPASAVPLIPPTTVTGLFSTDDEQQQFEFSIPAKSIVTIETISYGGGTFASNPAVTIGPGGFDPVISLFDGSGAFIDEDDDDDDFLGSTAVDPSTGLALDAFLQPTLEAGTYTVVITQFNNFFNGDVGDDIGLGFAPEGLLPGDDPTIFTSFFGCSDELFCDFDGNNRGFLLNGNLRSFFAVNVTAQAVPEPATLALLGFGLVGAGMVYRRRRED